MASALGAFLAAVVGVPLAGAAVTPGLKRAEAEWVALGDLTSFPIGEPKIVSFTSQQVDGYLRTVVSRTVWVLRRSVSDAVVFNSRCTHLGCLYSYQGAIKRFVCPCHGGVFAITDGAVVDGPPPRALDSLEQRIENGALLVNYHDFLVGTPEKKAL